MRLRLRLSFLFFVFFFFFFLSMSATTTLGIRTPGANEGDNDIDDNYSSNDQYQQSVEDYDYLGRWYRNHPRAPLTCESYPRLCKFQGSLGPDCCRRRCVDLRFDPFNCGRCGQRCAFGQMCCNGRCVNLLFDRNNCGWCNNKCAGEGSFCRYGMCSYA